ncbi:MAG TPA: biotin--[acetyl-CoA-carboxylase] ligase [Solirubrobacterales bacterium]|jgi:BirA family biotin operon repressor/biotin-[acetyl-CoA-carboxylase] ligase|nr:biotin--[acetyl-CoA-carboxylase] ligase [Solirubrobacterales bacterium]
MSFGTPHRHFSRTGSTNTRARELAAEGAEHGMVVTADEQTAGRGRQGRVWTAPAGKALLYSAIVRPLEERHLLLPLAVPLAVCEAAEELAADLAHGDEAAGDFRCGVKWPNDVLIEERKLAGILVEARPQDGWAVVGVGLNLTISPDEFPPDLRDTAVSIFDSSAGGRGKPRRHEQREVPSRLPPTPLTAAEVLSRHLAHWVQAEPEKVLAAWRQRDALLGREVAWDGGSGVADGVDDRGYLLVLTPGGDRIAVGAGEVHLTRR